jgi:hypothetical protein
MDKAQVIASVAGELHSSEEALDQAIAHATTLVQSMIGSRTALGLSAVVGADAQTKALEAIASLGAAREALVACHGALAKDHRRLGYGVWAGAPMDKYPEGDEQRPTPKGEHRLRAV